MKTLIAISLFTISLTACQSLQDRRDTGQRNDATAQKEINTAEKVLGDNKGGVVLENEDMVEYSYARKNEYTNKMRKDLDDIGVELAQLETRIEKSTGEAKTDAKVRLNEVQNQWTQARAQLERAEASNEVTWEETRVGTNKSYQDLNASIIKTRQWMNDKL